MLVERERLGPIEILRLNRPHAHNASNLPLKRELTAALEAGTKEPELGAIILTGNGRSFCAGGDIKEKPALSTGEVREGLELHQEICKRLGELDALTIAAIDGYALGGGLEMAVCCDLRVAGPRARLGAPVGQSGSLSTGGLHYRLPRLVGSGRAAEIILTGIALGADTALGIGLVNRIAEDPLAAALEWAGMIVEQLPASLRGGKRLLRYAAEASLAEVMDAELAACLAL